MKSSININWLLADALNGDSVAWGGLYAMTAIYMRDGEVVPEPLAQAMAERLDAMTVLLSHPDASIRVGLASAITTILKRGNKSLSNRDDVDLIKSIKDAKHPQDPVTSTSKLPFNIQQYLIAAQAGDMTAWRNLYGITGVYIRAGKVMHPELAHTMATRLSAIADALMASGANKRQGLANAVAPDLKKGRRTKIGDNEISLAMLALQMTAYVEKDNEISLAMLVLQRPDYVEKVHPKFLGLDEDLKIKILRDKAGLLKASVSWVLSLLPEEQKTDQQLKNVLIAAKKIHEKRLIEHKMAQAAVDLAGDDPSDDALRLAVERSIKIQVDYVTERNQEKASGARFLGKRFVETKKNKEYQPSVDTDYLLKYAKLLINNKK